MRVVFIGVREGWILGRVFRLSVSFIMGRGFGFLFIRCFRIFFVNMVIMVYI